MSKLSRPSFAPLALGLALGLATGGCRKPAEATPSNEASPSAPAVAPVVAATPSAEASEVFEASGVAQPVRSVRLSPKIGGILSSIKTREGALVTTGQVLCVLDTTDIALRADAAKVAADMAHLGATNANNDLRRAQELMKGGAMTSQGVEKAQLGADMAKLQAAQADVALRMAQQALADSSMRAPFAGVVTRVTAEEGQMIATMPPTAIFLLVDTSTLEVRVPIPERLLAQVHVGTAVHVTLPAINAEREAKIDRMPEVIDSMTRSAEAVIRLDNRDHALLGGLYARVRFPGVTSQAQTGEAMMSEAGAASGPEVKVQ